MYDEKPTNTFIRFISTFFSEYLVWLVIIFVMVIWYFFPEFIDTYGQQILFLAPVTILMFGFLIIITRTKIRTKKDQERGVNQYDITITKSTFYLIDFLIYGGSLLVLAVPVILENSIDIIDLIQALTLFLMGNLLKKTFYKKIIK